MSKRNKELKTAAFALVQVFPKLGAGGHYTSIKLADTIALQLDTDIPHTHLARVLDVAEVTKDQAGLYSYEALALELPTLVSISGEDATPDQVRG